MFKQNHTPFSAKYVIFLKKKYQNENQKLTMTFKPMNQLSLTLGNFFAMKFQQKLKMNQ